MKCDSCGVGFERGYKVQAQPHLEHEHVRMTVCPDCVRHVVGDLSGSDYLLCRYVTDDKPDSVGSLFGIVRGLFK